jgi:HK97 family phage prohead protease/HK97 family phage major capsid protein
MDIIRRATAATVGDGLDYVLSDGTIDRYQTVIEPSGWQLSNFLKNPIALFNHDKNFVIGKWKNVRVENNQLRGNLELLPAGISPRLDEIRAAVEAGALKGTSVGFLKLPNGVEPLRGVEGGLRYTKQELAEASLVSVPGNANALQIARSLNLSREGMSLLFGEQAEKEQPTIKRVSGEQAESHVSPKAIKMSIPLSKRIEDAEGELVRKKDTLEALVSADDADATQVEELTRQVEDDSKRIDGLKRAEEALARTAIVQVATTVESREEARPRAFAQPAEKLRPGEHYMRALIGAVVARARGHREPQAVYAAIAERFGQDGKFDEKTRVCADLFMRYEGERPEDTIQRSFAMVTRAVTVPATTTLSGWASQLVQTEYQGFLELLLPSSVFPGLAAKSMRMSFGRAGIISIPSRVSTPTVAGSFVAEGSPIPVRQAAYTSTPFTPKKMGVISSFTREIAEHSNPSIEELIRNAMQEDTAVSLDSVLLDATSATTTRPAGIKAGVAGLTATAGGGFTALVGDLKQLTNALITGSNGNLRRPVWLMNPAQQLSISVTQNAGGDFPFAAEINNNRFTNYPVIVSGNITAGQVFLLDAADFAVIEGGAPRFDLNDSAVLVYDDTAPAAVGTTGSPNVAGAPARSLWQTDSIGIRMIMDVNWGFVRSGTIAWTSAVTW